MPLISSGTKFELYHPQNLDFIFNERWLGVGGRAISNYQPADRHSFTSPHTIRRRVRAHAQKMRKPFYSIGLHVKTVSVAIMRVQLSSFIFRITVRMKDWIHHHFIVNHFINDDIGKLPDHGFPIGNFSRGILIRILLNTIQIRFDSIQKSQAKSSLLALIPWIASDNSFSALAFNTKL